MDRKGQLLPECGSISEMLETIPFIGDMCGQCASMFGIKAPLGPLGVVAIILTSLVTNTVNFLLSPVALAVVGVALIGSLVYKLR